VQHQEHIKQWGAPILVLLGIGVAYGPVLATLVRRWSTDDNYSHGFLIIPVAAYLVWERRTQLASLRPQPRNWGLLLVAAGLAALAAGTLGAEVFITRVSLPLVLAGSVLFLGGWPYLRVQAFPLLFLLLMIPIPAILFNRIAFPLQVVASRFAAAGLEALSIPVLRDGNVMILANTTLEVAEACSGIRSLISLVTLSVMYAYWGEPRRSLQFLLVFSVIPIVILTNGLRVVAIGVAAHYYGPAAAEGVFHTVSGWLIFVVALVLLLALHRLLVLVTSRGSRNIDLHTRLVHS